MKRSKLFLKLKKGMEKYKTKVKYDPICFDEDNKSISCTMSRYNLENFHEIINSSYEGQDGEINEEKLMDLENRINNYFNLYAPDDEEFMEFIKIISIYLIFIAKKPLHPPGIEFANGNTVYRKKNNYYCTGKSLFMKDKYSLCKYCIAR